MFGEFHEISRTGSRPALATYTARSPAAVPWRPGGLELSQGPGPLRSCALRLASDRPREPSGCDAKSLKSRRLQTRQDLQFCRVLVAACIVQKMHW